MLKKFPDYFNNFKMPEWAKPDVIEVYRACSTGKADKNSFLNSFEENGCHLLPGIELSEPSMYSLSTYTKYRDVKRFMSMTSKYGIPYAIAFGKTNPEYGICLETKVWKKMLGEKSKSSHVDYWLYENATPWLDFQMCSGDINEK